MQSKSITALNAFNECHLLDFYFHRMDDTLSNKNLAALVPIQSGSARPFRLSALHHDPDCIIWVESTIKIDSLPIHSYFHTLFEYIDFTTLLYFLPYGFLGHCFRPKN